jgi:uncharacterized damage-inducible protein DinB
MTSKWAEGLPQGFHSHSYQEKMNELGRLHSGSAMGSVGDFCAGEPMSECARLADQIRRAFEGEAWHGDSLLEILSGVNAGIAAERPILNAHSIWELVLHIAAWDDITIRRSQGTAVKPTDEQNFPPVKETGEGAWQQTLEAIKKTHADLVRTVAAFPDSRLGEQVPGKTQSYYNFYYLFSGIVQHELYHAGQIALLKKAAR